MFAIFKLFNKTKTTEKIIPSPKYQLTLVRNVNHPESPETNEILTSVSFNGKFLSYETVHAERKEFSIADISSFLLKNMQGDILYIYGMDSLLKTKEGLPLSILVGNTNYSLKKHDQSIEGNIESPISIHGNTLFIGRTGSGKSLLMRRILGSPTEYTNNLDLVIYFGREYEAPAQFKVCSIAELSTMIKNNKFSSKYIHTSSVSGII